MRNNIEKHYRHTIRLKDYDYSQSGSYFVTVCVHNRHSVFGYIGNENIFLNNAGEMVKSVWINLPKRFPHIILDEFIVMPNHIHGIILINCRGESCIRPNPVDRGDHKDRPYRGTETCMVFLYPVSCFRRLT